MTDYYKILGVSHSATIEEIKRAYRFLALKYHPDVNHDKNSDEYFKLIANAYSVLSNKDTRIKYDLYYQQYNQQIHYPKNKSDKPDKSKEKNSRIAIFSIISLFFISAILLLITYSNNSNTIESTYITPPNGDLDNAFFGNQEDCKTAQLWEMDVDSFIEKTHREIFSNLDIGSVVEIPHSENLRDSDISTPKQFTKEEKIKLEKDSLLKHGWKDEAVKNGQLSQCYNFQPTVGTIDNYLEIIVSKKTDVVIKIMEEKMDKCIRYVFVNRGSSYKICNIPEGRYYLKIAYGEEWMSKIENKKCIGRFLRNKMYTKGEDILDFNIEYEEDGYIIPSFTLSLDVIKESSNTFNSEDISESEFND